MKIKVDNEFLKKIDFICAYFDLNNLEKYSEKDDCFFPISINEPKMFDTRSDVKFDDDYFEFNLSILNHEIHESYNSHIRNCTFRLRLLVDFILSYNS